MRGTLNNPNRLGVSIIKETIGEAAVALQIKGCNFYIGFNVEGLGTKNKIAESMSGKARIGDCMGVDKRRLFSGIGQDEMAMTLNDLLSIGALPVMFEPIVATGSDDYLTDFEKASGIIDGFEKGAKIAGVAIPGGETPTLKGVVYPNTIDLAGGSLGIIKPKSNLTVGDRLEAGLTIYWVESSGIHANGISLPREIIEKTEGGYFAELPSGRTIGEALLTPTTIYSPFVESLFENGVDVRYMQPITGYGWAKIMRKNKQLTYLIENVPEPQEEFSFLQEMGEVNNEEAYKTWNMGIGWVFMTPNNDSAPIKNVGKKMGLRFMNLVL